MTHLDVRLLMIAAVLALMAVNDHASTPAVALDEVTRRYAIMRMQPELQRWSFTGWRPIRLEESSNVEVETVPVRVLPVPVRRRERGQTTLRKKAPRPPQQVGTLDAGK